MFSDRENGRERGRQDLSRRIQRQRKLVEAEAEAEADSQACLAGKPSPTQASHPWGWAPMPTLGSYLSPATLFPHPHLKIYKPLSKSNPLSPISSVKHSRCSSPHSALPL